MGAEWNDSKPVKTKHCQMLNLTMIFLCFLKIPTTAVHSSIMIHCTSSITVNACSANNYPKKTSLL